MSKPLAFVLQLGGLIAFFIGIGNEPMELNMVVIGLALAIAGGVGIRARVKAEKKA